MSYQVVRNASFLENFTYVLSVRSPNTRSNIISWMQTITWYIIIVIVNNAFLLTFSTHLSECHVQWINKDVQNWFFFYLGFLSRTFTNHRTVGEGGRHLFNSSLPLPLASLAGRHWPGDYCRELTSSHS